MHAILDWLKERWKEAGGVVLGLILLFFLLKTSDMGRVAHGFEKFPYWLLLVVFALVVGREAIRIVEWQILLRQLGIVARWRHTVLALLGGDASQIIPAGIYVSNIFLKREEDASVPRSLSATMAVQYLEVIGCLLVLAAIGVPRWPWLRVAAVVVLVGFLSFFFLISRPQAADWLEARANRGKVWGKIVDALKQLLEGIEGLLAWRALVPAFLLALAHLAFTIACLFVIMRGLGLDKLGWTQAAAIYSFVLTIVNLNPLPTDIGVSEGSGMSVFIADGVPQADGLTAMLLVRFAIIISTAVLLAIALAILPRATKHLVEGPTRQDAVANAEADPNRDVEEVKEAFDSDSQSNERRGPSAATKPA